MRAVVRATLFPLATAALFAAGLGGAAAQSPPSLQEYSLYDRFFGSGGAVFPNYSRPSEGGIAYVIGRGSARGDIFAAGTADFNCQPSQAPRIEVMSAPQGGQVFTRLGNFTATGIDAGITKCVGQKAFGSVVSYKGPRTPGATVTLRVIYPTLGAWYTHVVPVARP